MYIDTRVSFTTGSFAGSENADYPNDSRQSSLYNWWNGKAKEIGNLTEGFDELKTSFIAEI